jgi:hypothetical protein
MEHADLRKIEERALRDALFIASNSRHGQAMRKAVDFRYRAIGAMGMGDLNFTGLESEATNQAIRILLKAQDQRLVFY